MPEAFKLGHLVSPGPPEPTFEAHAYGNLWMRQTIGPTERLALAPDHAACGLIIDLTRPLAEPFGLLYVVLYPHFGHERGRYQAKTPLGRTSMERFFRDYAEFFEMDGRHNIWACSLEPDGRVAGQIIYDHHNIIYAYGPLEAYAEVAAARGLVEGPVVVPRDHRHQFDPRYNRDESNLINEREWITFPTEESDY